MLFNVHQVQIRNIYDPCMPGCTQTVPSRINHKHFTYFYMVHGVMHHCRHHSGYTETAPTRICANQAYLCQLSGLCTVRTFILWSKIFGLVIHICNALYQLCALLYHIYDAYVKYCFFIIIIILQLWGWLHLLSLAKIYFYTIHNSINSIDSMHTVINYDDTSKVIISQLCWLQPCQDILLYYT